MCDRHTGSMTTTVLLADHGTLQHLVPSQAPRAVGPVVPEEHNPALAMFERQRRHRAVVNVHLLTRWYRRSCHTKNMRLDRQVPWCLRKERCARRRAHRCVIALRFAAELLLEHGVDELDALTT